MSNYDYLAGDEDLEWYRDKLPNYDALVNDTVSDMEKLKVPREYAKGIVLNILQDALRAYSLTEHTTRSGGILRKVAAFLSLLNPMRWISSK